MKILFVAAEASPLVKVGGLADVVGSLPSALKELGHDVRLIIPQYGCIDFSQHQLITVKDRFEVPVMHGRELACLNATTIRGRIPVYLVGDSQYFEGKEIYGADDLRRFFFFSRAVLEILPQLDWQPEIVHCHDWHAALVVMWLKKARFPYASVFTIHNLAYQGAFDEAFLTQSGLEEDWGSPLQAPEAPLNFISQGILWADLITTVSDTYAEEIVTLEQGGGLDSLLLYRQKDLLGIVNGIDYEEYNPKADPYIPANYDSSTPEKRLSNKLALQRRANLPEDAGIPLIGMVQRLQEQKGFDILEKAADALLHDREVQFVVLGRGSEYYETMLKQIAARYPRQVALFTDFNEPLAHLIYAGCDMFLMPSRFEPCGLGQLIAMRYGALPIVRHTGGLVDTVAELTDDLKEGSGFVFHDYAPEALVAAVGRGIEAFGRQESWLKAVQRVMRLDFSWRASALKYQAAYQRVLDVVKGRG